MKRLSQQFFISLLVLSMVVAQPAQAQSVTLDDLIVRVQSMMEEMAKLQVQLQALKKGGTTAVPTTPGTGAVLGASSFKFTQDLSVGATNDDITKIQTLLKQDPLIYPEGTVSGFFGPKTVEALRNLQKRFGLDPVGVVGPATQALLQRLISQQNADGTYPKDILDPTRPTGSVLGDSTSKPVVTPVTPTVPTTPTTPTKPTTKEIERITYEYDGGDVEFTVEYSDGSEKDYDTEADSPKKVAAAIADELGIDEDEVEDVLEEDEKKSDDDEVDEITVKIRATDAVVTVYYTDDTKERFTLEETDEDDLIEAIADEIGLDEDEVEDLTEFETDFNVDEVEEINVTVYESEDTAEVSVEMEDKDDDREFEIDANEDEDEMIEDIAKELDVDADDIEDLVEFDYED